MMFSLIPVGTHRALWGLLFYQSFMTLCSRLEERRRIQKLGNKTVIGVGGKFEDGESPEECLLREVWEETGLKLTSFRLRGIVTFSTDVYPTEYMFLFTADGYTGEIGECNEGNLEWVKKSEVYDLPIWEGDKVFFRLLEEDVPVFSLKLRYEGDKLVETMLNGELYTELN